MLFLAHLYESTESCCCHFDMGVGVGITLQSFRSKFFYVMGKALSGKLSCTGTGLFFFFTVALFLFATKHCTKPRLKKEKECSEVYVRRFCLLKILFQGMFSKLIMIYLFNSFLLKLNKSQP